MLRSSTPVVFSLALGLAACGGDDAPDGPTGTGGGVPDSALTLNIIGAIDGSIIDPIDVYQCTLFEESFMAWSTSQTLDPERLVHGSVFITADRTTEVGTFTADDGVVADLSVSLEADGVDYALSDDWTLTFNEVGDRFSGGFTGTVHPLENGFVDDTQPGASVNGSFYFFVKDETCL